MTSISFKVHTPAKTTVNVTADSTDTVTSVIEKFRDFAPLEDDEQYVLYLDLNALLFGQPLLGGCALDEAGLTSDSELYLVKENRLGSVTIQAAMPYDNIVINNRDDEDRNYEEEEEAAHNLARAMGNQRRFWPHEIDNIIAKLQTSMRIANDGGIALDDKQFTRVNMSAILRRPDAVRQCFEDSDIRILQPIAFGWKARNEKGAHILLVTYTPGDGVVAMYDPYYHYDQSHAIQYEKKLYFWQLREQLCSLFGGLNDFTDRIKIRTIGYLDPQRDNWSCAIRLVGNAIFIAIEESYENQNLTLRKSRFICDALQTFVESECNRHTDVEWDHFTTKLRRMSCILGNPERPLGWHCTFEMLIDRDAHFDDENGEKGSCFRFKRI